jgi:hypothetical protein
LRLTLFNPTPTFQFPPNKKASVLSEALTALNPHFIFMEKDDRCLYDAKSARLQCDFQFVSIRDDSHLREYDSSHRSLAIFSHHLIRLVRLLIVTQAANVLTVA